MKVSSVYLDEAIYPVLKYYDILTKSVKINQILSFEQGNINLV